MLLIPDIHINTQYRDQIISKLSDIITSHPDEKHIILLGDYVYMFSYDRDALLALYKLLIGRYHEGKTIYVLAGNHDWHSQHFVYEESRQAWDIINQALFTKEGGEGSETGDGKGAIHFITTPQIYQIEGESVLMMPYMIDWSSQIALFGKEGSEGSETGDGKIDSNEVPPGQKGGSQIGGFVPHHSLYTALTQSTNKYEQASGRLNLTLEHYTQNYKVDTIIHHYYTADTQFPGLKTQFSYRDIAIDPYRITAKYDMITGHIHHPFVYGKYLCCGSLWNTAANETNQLKYYRIKHSTTIQGYQLQINPHLTLEHPGQPVTYDHIKQHRQHITSQDHENLNSSHRQIMLHHESLQQHLITLSIITNQHYESSDLIDQSLIPAIKSVTPKYKTAINHDHQHLERNGDSLQTSIIQRKEILQQYIISKHPNNHPEYLELLQELNITS